MFLNCSPYLVVHGQLTNEVQNGVVLSRTYDTLNRPTGYSLDEEESLRSLRSLRLEYSYDSLGRFVSVSAPGGTRFVVSANPSTLQPFNPSTFQPPSPTPTSSAPTSFRVKDERYEDYNEDS